MPQERLHVQCVVVLATNRTFMLFRYLKENNVVFQYFCSITFESTETLTDMWCDYSTHNLECPGRLLASIFPCHRSDCKCSCGGVGDDWNVHLIQVFLKETYVVAEAFAIGFPDHREFDWFVLPVFHSYSDISWQTFGKHISMPQERLQVECSVVLATNRMLIWFKYLAVNYV